MMKENKNPYNKYKETQIKTATQGKLIVMLYDGAIKFINQSKECIIEKQIEDSHKNIIRAQDIIMELVMSLNMEAGEIAKKLYNLYLFMNQKLMEANMYKKTEPLDQVLKMLIDLKEVWEKVAHQTSSADDKVMDNNLSVNISS